MYGYIYETINQLNGIFYIGKHKGLFNPNYHGGGLILNRVIHKYGNNIFKTKLISYSRNRINLNKMEIAYIAAYRIIYGKKGLYNVANGGDGGITKIGYHLSEETKEKMRKPKTIETRIKMSKNNARFWFGKSTWNTGLNIKTDIRLRKSGRKISRAFFGRKWIHNIKLNQSKQINPNSIQQYLDNNWIYGRGECHTKESREKLRLNNLGKYNGKKNPMFGVHRFGKNAPTYGTKRMYNKLLEKNKYIKTPLISKYLSNGWIFGFLK